MLLLFSVAYGESACAWSSSNTIFGYPAEAQGAMDIFPEWLKVMHRHPREDVPDPGCGSNGDSGCQLHAWLAYLDTLKGRSEAEQIKAVNHYGNRTDYVLDPDNWGQEDYWAIVKEFMQQGGDCEDYAITKLYSLRYLGFPAERLRIVIIMDGNLGVPHAVLAVDMPGRTLILDNQAEEVLPDNAIVHYAPVFSINETGWWMHLPPG